MEAKPAGTFRLLDYFKLASLIAFGAVAVAMFVLERAEQTFFDATQQAEGVAFEQAQAGLLAQQQATARASLVAQHEASHLDLAHILSNSLWDSHFAALVAHAPGATGVASADAAVQSMMKGSTVFKVKVYDLKGMTVYSSEAAQIGEDKASNKGWASAVKGVPVSELVHRDRFSALEGVVEHRDLIQSYMPVLRGGQVTGVFEIYSDVTGLLREIRQTTAGIESLAAINAAKVEAASLENRERVKANSTLHFAIVAVLLAGLYVALFLLVRNAQRILDEQARARETALLREHAMHHEKMAALAAMAANASHEIGNPLAIISGHAQDIERAAAAGEPLAPVAAGIVQQADRIAEMTRRLTDFATARSEEQEPLDLNEMIRSVRDFMSYDSRYKATKFDAWLEPRLPVCVGIPEHLNEVLMNLLQSYAEASLQTGTTVHVRTRTDDGRVKMRVDCEDVVDPQPCRAAMDSRMDSAKERVESMGGRFAIVGTATEIMLPCY